MAENPATAQDIADRWRPLTNDEFAQATARLEDAWELLVAEVPGLAAAVDAGKVPLALVRVTLVRAVLREMKNPDGVTMRQRSLAEYSEQDQWAGPVGSSALFAEEDLRPLLSAMQAGRPSMGAFTIRPGAGVA